MQTNQRERAELRMRLATRLLGGKCTRCKRRTNLDFDHVDPSTKLFVISTGSWRANEIAFWNEVEKCQLLCNEHHQAKSLADREQDWLIPTEERVQRAVELRAGGMGFEAIAMTLGIHCSTAWHDVNVKSKRLASDEK